jgi:glycosyltransferase involved in cell wall biosynthesis
MLAIVDTNFPKLLSGFRYWENYEFHRIDKGILFFSLNKMDDYFPANVLPLSSIQEYSLTDIYCIFLNHTLGLLDCPLEIPGKQNYGLSSFIREKEISIHTTIGPGGGYEDVSHWAQVVKGLEFLRDHPNVKNVFTNLHDVEKIIPSAHHIAGIVNTDLYAYIPRAENGKLHLLFVAHRPLTFAQKGLDYLIKALNLLAPSKYHLHIVGGDWSREISLIKNYNYTYYGTLSPNKLREVMYKCHIIVNPTYKKNVPAFTRFINRGKTFASIDSFPTTAAAEAMATGCSLISTNPRNDYFALLPGEDYIEIEEKSVDDIVSAIEYLYANQSEMLSMARKGYEKICKFFDYKKNVNFKYNVIKGKIGF